MENIKIFNYNNFQIEFEVINGQVFANATAMCQAFGKRPSHWLELENTKRYISALQEAVSEKTALVETRNGGANPGTWIHQRLILKLSSWLDVNLELWCDERIMELLKTGKVELNPKRDGIAQIEQHTYRPVQIQSAKAANHYAFTKQNGKEDAMAWHRKNCFYFTGKTPFELKQWAIKNNVPSKDRTSGKEIIRKFRPDKAAGVSIADFIHSMGEPDDVALKIGEQAMPVVNMLLKYQDKQLK